MSEINTMFLIKTRSNFVAGFLFIFDPSWSETELYVYAYCLLNDKI